MDILGIGSLVAQTFNGWRDRKHTEKLQKMELKQVIHLAKLDNVKQGKIAEVQWNNTSIQQAGWRPGFLTIVLSLPMILVFIPQLVPYMQAGFVALDQTPVWYRSAIAVMISSAFGFKKFADWQMGKHYTLPDPLDKIGRKRDEN